MFMCNLGIDVTLFHIPCSPLSGVWHFGGGQREIPHRRLLCEPDITGAGFPQFCPVPALHREREEVSGARSPSVHLSSTPAAALDLRTWTCLGHTAAVHTGWSRAWLISSSIFTLTTNIHAHTHTHKHRASRIQLQHFYYFIASVRLCRIVHAVVIVVVLR